MNFPAMNFPHWLDATPSLDATLPLVQALLHTLWQGALLAGGLWLLLRWIPARRATLRYSVCLGALSAVLLLGFGAWAMLDASIKTTPRPSAASVEISRRVVLQAAPSLLPASTAVFREMPRALAPRETGNSWARWAAAFWLLGVVICLVRTLHNVVGAGRLRRRCRALTDPPLLALVEELRTRLRLSRPVRLLVSAEIHVPAVLGVVWPTILLPAAMLSGLPVDQLRAILAHELAHIRRCDYLVNLGQMLIEALLFFNPFVWWISRQVRLEREACCDQIAAAECPSAVRYVEALVAVIERHRSAGAGRIPQPLLAASGSESGSGKSQTLDRARRLLVPEYLPQLRLHWFSLALVLMLSALALGGLWTSARAVAQTIQPPRESETKRISIPRADDILCNAQVSTDDGTPLGAGTTVVRVHSQKSNVSTEELYDVNTDGTVPIWFNTADTSVTVVAIREGYAPAFSGPFLPPLKEKLDGLKIQLHKGFAASLHIVDEGGQPIVGAQIIGYYPSPPVVELPTVQTDATGTATIEHLGPAALNVRIRAPGFQSDELTAIHLDPAQPYRWILKKGTSLAGRVITSTTGESIAGATIKLAGVRGPHDESYSDPRQAPLITTADANGQFALTTLRPDSRYYFFVEAPGYGGVFLRNIRLDQGELRVTLGKELSVRGKIIHAPPAMLYEGKLHLVYSQTFRIGNFYNAFSQQFQVLEPKAGEVDFQVGGFFVTQGAPEADPDADLNVELAELSVRNKHANIPLAELPKTDFVFDLGAETQASEESPKPSPAKESPAQPVIEIESKFIEIPDAIANGLTFPRRDSFMDKYPGTPPAASTAGSLSLRTVLNEKDAEDLLSKIHTLEGVDILSAPRITTRSQQRAVVEIIRECRYPTEYERDKSNEGKPAIPTAFGTRNVGVTLEVEPTILEGETINLKLKPRVVEFLGFISYPLGETIPVKREPGEKLGNRLMKIDTPDRPLAPDEIRQPVFSTRETTGELTIQSGQTVVFLGSGETENILFKLFKQPDAGKQLMVLVRAARVKAAEPSNTPKLEAIPQPANTALQSELPTGTAVERKTGFVISPYSPDAGYIDVRGFPSGTEVKDPYSGKMFRVP